MATNNLIVRLALEHSKFDSGMTQTRRELDKLSKSGVSLDGVLSKGLSTIGKYAGAGAVASAGVKLLKDTFVSSTRDIDTWQRGMDTAKGAYEAFCGTLRSGDWGNFFENIKNAISGAQELYDALDALGTLKLERTVDDAKFNDKMADLRLQLKQGKMTVKEFNAEVMKLKPQLDAINQRQAAYSMNAAKASVTSYLNSNGVTAESQKKYLRSYYGGDVTNIDNARNTNLRDNVLPQLERVLNKVKSNIANNQTYSQYQRRYITNGEGAAKGLEGYYSKFVGGDMGKGNAYNNVLELQRELERRIDFLKVMTNADNTEAGTKAIQAITEAIESGTKGRAGISDFLMRERGGTVKSTTTATPAVPAELINYDISQAVMDSITTPIEIPVEFKPITNGMMTVWKKDNEQRIRSFANEQEIAAQQTREAWVGAANAMSGVGSALQSIEDPGAKVAGILAQAVANVMLGFAQASASPATGAAGVFGWIAAATSGLVTAITMVSQIKSVGKFAEGGVVGGSSYAGDRLFAKVNSGEVVLNQQQIGNALAMIEGGNGGRTSAGGYVNGEHIFIGVNNYLRRTGRGELITSR